MDRWVRPAARRAPHQAQRIDIRASLALQFMQRECAELPRPIAFQRDPVHHAFMSVISGSARQSRRPNAEISAPSAPRRRTWKLCPDNISALATIEGPPHLLGTLPL